MNGLRECSVIMNENFIQFFVIVICLDHRNEKKN